MSLGIACLQVTMYNVYTMYLTFSNRFITLVQCYCEKAILTTISSSALVLLLSDLSLSEAC